MQATRQLILDYLREHGEAAVRELGAHLDLTATGVRQHLAVLEREGLVASREVRGRVGRPAMVYRLTAQGEALYPKAYDDLARALMAALTRTLPPAQQRALLMATAEALAAPHLPRLEGRSPRERMRAARDLLREQQVVARCAVAGEGFELYEATCPFHDVAVEQPAICEMERVLLERLTGMEVELRTWQRAGADHCSFRLTPVGTRPGGTAATPGGDAASR